MSCTRHEKSMFVLVLCIISNLVGNAQLSIRPLFFGKATRRKKIKNKIQGFFILLIQEKVLGFIDMSSGVSAPDTPEHQKHGRH